MPMYDPKFSVKQMYDNYGSSRSTPASRSASAGKQAAASMKSAGIGGLGGRATTSSAQRIQDSFRDMRESSRTSGGTSVVAQDNNPNRDEFENKSTLQKLKEKAINLFESFGAEEPEALIVDNKRVYQGPLFRGYDPTTRIGDFGGEYGKQQYLFGQESLGIFGPGIKTTRSPTPPFLPPSTINMFGVNTDNPRLNTFGVERKSFRGPDPLELSVSPDVPANMDPLTRGLSQAMIPDPVVPTADYKTQAGDTLFSIQKTLKENGINTTVEEIAEINDIGLDGIFGIKPGTELKLPMPNTDAAPKEVKAALEKLTPITMEEEKSLVEQLADYTKYMKDKVAEELGIDVETDQETLNKAAGLGAKQKITTDNTKDNITAYQNKLNSLGFYSGSADGAYGKRTKNGIKMYQQRNGLTVTGEMNEETAKRLNSGNSIVPTSTTVGNLTVSTAYRDEIDPSQLVIATDFNANIPKANGVEVVLPPVVFNAGPGNQHYDAAVKYIELVKDFFESKGYGEYKIRGSNVSGGQAGLRRSNDGSGQRGRGNTIHTEPFFSSDTKAVNIVNENKEEFFDLYIQAFGNTTGAILTAPHGKISDEDKQDRGAVNSILGAETDLGDETITHIMKKYGNK